MTVLDRYFEIYLPEFEKQKVEIDGVEYCSGFIGNTGVTLIRYDYSKEVDIDDPLQIESKKSLTLTMNHVELYFPFGGSSEGTPLRRYSPFLWVGPFTVSLQAIYVSEGVPLTGDSYRYIQFVTYFEGGFNVFGLRINDLSVGIRYTFPNPLNPPPQGPGGFAMLGTASFVWAPGAEGAQELAGYSPIKFEVGLQVGMPKPESDFGLFLRLDYITLYDIIAMIMSLLRVEKWSNREGWKPYALIPGVFKQISLQFRMCIAPLTQINFQKFQAKCTREVASPPPEEPLHDTVCPSSRYDLALF